MKVALCLYYKKICKKRFSINLLSIKKCAVSFAYEIEYIAANVKLLLSK